LYNRKRFIISTIYLQIDLDVKFFINTHVYAFFTSITIFILLKLWENYESLQIIFILQIQIVIYYIVFLFLLYNLHNLYFFVQNLYNKKIYKKALLPLLPFYYFYKLKFISTNYLSLLYCTNSYSTECFLFFFYLIPITRIREKYSNTPFFFLMKKNTWSFLFILISVTYRREKNIYNIIPPYLG
jgi:hypothetical protein